MTSAYILELLLNTTIEERVALLEIQVVEIQEDVTELDEDVTLLEGDVNFLFNEQVIQDARLLTLEQENDIIDDELESEFSYAVWPIITCSKNWVIFPSIGLLATTISLDFRVTALEENGADDGNSSVVELELRVETLEETAADHETRISTTELDVGGKINSWTLKLEKS